MSQANVYDSAHRLASSIKASPEYADFRLAAAKLKSERSSMEMLRDFRTRQFELQSRMLQGQDVSDEEQEKLEQLSEIVTSHAIVSAFLQAEYKLSRLLGDIQKIIADAVEVDLDEEGE